MARKCKYKKIKLSYDFVALNNIIHFLSILDTLFHNFNIFYYKKHFILH